MKIKLLNIFLFLVLFCTPAGAALLNRPIVSESLPDGMINAITSDSDGYVWIGSHNGLFRHNGTSFRAYYGYRNDVLLKDNIQCLFADSDDRIWIGHPLGISLLQNGVFVPLPSNASGLIKSIQAYDDGNLLLSDFGGLGIFDKEQYTMTYLATGSDYALCSWVVRLPDGGLWVLNEDMDRISILGPDAKPVSVLEFPKGNFVTGMVYRQGRILVSTGTGLECYDSATAAGIAPPEFLRQFSRSRFTFLISSGDNLFWGADGAIYKTDGNAVVPIGEYDPANVDYITAHYSSGCLWLSEDGFGLKKISTEESRSIIRFPGLQKNEKIFTILPVDGDNLMIGTNQHFYFYDDKTKVCKDITPSGITSYSSKSGHFGQMVFSPREREIWLNTDKSGLTRYIWDGKVLKPDDSYPSLRADILWGDDEGNTFVLSGSNLIKISPEGSTRTRVLTEKLQPISLQKSADGQTFIICQTGVYRFVNGSSFQKLPFPEIITTSFYKDGDGGYWLGTYTDGLYQFDGQFSLVRHYNMDNGFPDNEVWEIGSDGSGSVLVSTGNYILRVSPAAGKVLLISNPNEESRIFSSMQTGMICNGRIYFGGKGSLTCSSAEEYSPVDIPVTIDAVTANGSPVDISSGEPVILNHRQNSLSFRYSAKYFRSDRLNYSYMLDGFDKSWIDAGWSMQAGYSNLPSGRYTFMVRVRDSNGNPGEADAVFGFKIERALWARPFMIVLYLLAGTAVIVLILWALRSRRRLDEQLRQEQQEKVLSAELDKERTAFFMNITHELRAPLSLIYGPSRELSVSSELSPHSRQLAETIMNNSNRMLHLSGQLLDLDRLRQDRKLKVMETELSALLCSLTREYGYIAAGRQVDLSCEVPDTLKVFCDVEKVEKIVLNLLSNAVKYTPRGGSVIVSASVSSDCAEVSVSDTGIGIPESRREKIFERYERIRQAVDRDGVPEGFGIGLNYAMFLADLHKGSLECRPNTPKGTVMTFCFPAASSGYTQEDLFVTGLSASPASATEVSPAPSEGRQSILIVEDNADLREYLQHLLESSYNVSGAPDGLAAMNSISLSPPDLVISDVLMPFKNGIELCRELKESQEYCHIPVILLTARNADENRIEGIVAGADAYVGKPFDPIYLRSVVDNIFANKRRLQQTLKAMSADPSEVSEAAEDPLASYDRKDQEFLRKLFALIDKNLSDEDFNVSSCATELGISRTGFYTKVKALIGEAPQTFLVDYRLNKAMELLKKGDLNVSEVCYSVGFKSTSGFSRSFKKKFGVPPSEI
jgi:signal transduction histidine kinase/DNA-binding response OmpR family regulator/ligand-binding sensor domain-containing protein